MDPAKLREGQLRALALLHLTLLSHRKDRGVRSLYEIAAWGKIWEHASWYVLAKHEKDFVRDALRSGRFEEFLRVAY